VLASLGQRHGHCGVNEPERAISGYDQMLGHYCGIWCVKFGEEKKY
jgi:hypothetical protein